MTTLRVRLFGKFLAATENQVIEAFESRKAHELLCYLLLHRDRPHPRESLASLLWGNTSTAQSKSYLRKALWQLQRSLGGLGASAGDLITVEHDWVQISSGDELWLDVAVLEQSLEGLLGVPGQVIDHAAAARLSQAVELYRGELLDGWYQDWCLFERERLQDLYLALLDKMIGYCEAAGLYERGIAYGALMLHHDRAREETYRYLMRLYMLSGDRTGALRVFERCSAVLASELQVKPTAYTVALYEQIRASEPGTILPLPAEPPPITDLPSVAAVLERLKATQLTLAEIQRRLAGDIQAIERAMRQLGG